MHNIKSAALLLFLCLLMQPISAVKADDVNIVYTVLKAGSSYIQIPMILGLEDSEVQKHINNAIIVDGGFSAYEAIFHSLTDPNETGIQLMTEAKVLGEFSDRGLLTVKIEAFGRIGPGRPGHRVTALMYDVESGKRVSAGDLFKDIQQTQTALDELVEEDIEPWMSDYLTPDELYPIPLDNLLLDEAGITFYYDQSKFNTLSERSGAINFHYDVLIDLLRLEQGSVLDKLDEIKNAQNTVTSIERAVSRGYLPGLPVFVGDMTEEVLISFPSLFDSEAFPTGERFQLEDARFRDSWVISNGEQIIGVMSYRINFYGLKTGMTHMEQVIQTLGEPLSKTDLDDDAALSYALVSGELFSYAFGENTLYLNFDEQSVLHTVWLSQST